MSPLTILGKEVKVCFLIRALDSRAGDLSLFELEQAKKHGTESIHTMSVI